MVGARAFPARTIATAGVTVLLAGAGLVAGAAQVALPPQDLELLSVADNGGQGAAGADSADVAVSASGRYVAFDSMAALGSATVAGVTNVYLRDRETGHTLLLSRGLVAGVEVGANGDSTHPAISADGRYVAFDTKADNLPGVTASAAEPSIVVCDRDPDGDGVLDERLLTGALDLRYSVLPKSGVAFDGLPSISADAGTVAWMRTLPGTGGYSVVAHLTRDAAGRLIMPAANTVQTLLPTDPSAVDVEHGDGAPVVSADGAHVVFPVHVCSIFCGDAFGARPLLRLNGALALAAPPTIQNAVYVADLPSLQMSRMDTEEDGQGRRWVISGDGATVAYVADTGPAATVTVVRRAPTGERQSADVLPTAAPPTAVALSADARYLAYAVPSPDDRMLVRDLVVDQQRARAGLARLPDEPAAIRACQRQQTPCQDGNPTGTIALSADGTTAVFDSGATDLVPGDGNVAIDVFARPFRPAADADPVDFGQADDPQTRTITVRHNGFGPLRIDQVSATGAFDVYPQQNCAGSVLYETGQCVVSVRFTPPATGGEQTGELTVQTSTGVLHVPLRGVRGPTPPPTLSASPDEVAFGGTRLALSQSTPSGVALTAAGSPVTITDLVLLTGPNLYPQDYQVDRGCVGRTLQPGDTCTVLVTSRPLGGGDRPGALVIVSDAAAGPLTVALHASGVSPSLAVDPLVATVGAVVTVSGTGFPARQAVSVTASGVLPRIAADDQGWFAVPMVILHHTVAGVVVVSADGPPGTDVHAWTTMVVEAGSAQPPDFLTRK